MSNNQDNGQVRHTTKSVRESMPSTTGILGVVFGIFMVIVYCGMGVLLCINFFEWGADWAWTRWIVGIALIIYGLYRGYRTYATVKSHGNTDKNDA